jgi:hypothetical protein
LMMNINLRGPFRRRLEGSMLFVFNYLQNLSIVGYQGQSSPLSLVFKLLSA